MYFIVSSGIGIVQQDKTERKSNQLVVA
uniref:Uncharacterized protein n=1 Tax=Arundo donax TaxID=35708 RepID=A0A0A9G8I8_ARUDO